MEVYKLHRPIKDHNENEITEVKIKSEDEVSAVDFFDISLDVNESGEVKNNIGTMKETVGNIAGLTTNQVCTLHIKDYLYLSGIVGKYMGE